MAGPAWMRFIAAPIRGADRAIVGGIVASLDIDRETRPLQALDRTREELEARVEAAVRDHEAAQARLAHAQRMEAPGQLAGGIAHDFNNLLQAVSGRLRLIQRRAGESEDIQTIARMALEAAERGASVTARLLSATLPVLLLTGYADESLDLDTITENGVVLLRKPVAGSKLATRAALLLRPDERADAAVVVTEAEAEGDAAGHRP